MKMTIEQVENGKLETTIIGDYSIEILQHDDSNSREWDNIATLYCRNRNYKLGDYQIPKSYNNNEGDTLNIDDQADFENWLKSEGVEILAIRPLSLYDHGGISISMGGGRDQWDSSSIGWVVVTKAQADLMGIDDRSEENLVKIMGVEVKIYDQDLTGDVWGYTVEKITHCEHCQSDTSEEVDRCYGYYDDDSLLQAINENLPEGGTK